MTSKEKSIAAGEFKQTCLRLSLDRFTNQGPADRFLVATSVVEGLPLITADQRIQDYDGVETLS